LSITQQAAVSTQIYSLTHDCAHSRPPRCACGRMEVERFGCENCHIPQQLFDMSNSTTNMTLSFIQPQTILNLARKIRNTYEISQPRHLTTSPSLTTTSLTITPKPPHTVYNLTPSPSPSSPLPTALENPHPTCLEIANTTLTTSTITILVTTTTKSETSRHPMILDMRLGKADMIIIRMNIALLVLCRQTRM
jgi:hypothetical protein